MPTMLCHNQGEFEKDFHICLFARLLQKISNSCMQNLEEFCVRRRSNKIHIEFLIQANAFLPSLREETKLLLQQNVLVFHFRAICRETNIIFAEMPIVSCPKDRKKSSCGSACTHTHTHIYKYKLRRA